MINSQLCRMLLIQILLFLRLMKAFIFIKVKIIRTKIIIDNSAKL